MTISSTTNRNNYTGNDTTDTYNYSFRVFAETDFVITVRNTTTDVETELTLTTDYTVTSVGVVAGGTIVLAGTGKAWQGTGGNLDTGYEMTIRRVVGLTQSTDIRNQGDFFPEVHEDVFDKLTMIAQQQQDELDRTAKLPETIDPSDFNPEIPADIVGEDSVTIMTDPTGAFFVPGPSADTIAGATTSAAAAAASAVAADASATVAAASEAAAIAASSKYQVFANAAAYVVANGTAESGDVYYDSTDNVVKTYKSGAWHDEVLLDTAQTLTNKTLTSPVLNTGISGTAFLDEDTMSSDAADKVASQQSIKAYVDAHAADTSNHGTTGAIVGTTDTQTLTNKTFDDELRLKEIASPGASASGYQDIFVDTADNKVKKIDSSGVVSELGGGVGSLNTFHTEDFETNGAADFTTGNNATVDAAGTGTLDGTLADETTLPLSSDTSLGYVQGSSSVNDFFLQDADIAIELKQRANDVGVSFYYAYVAGADDDIRFFALDQDDNELTTSIEYLKVTGAVATRFTTSFYIPAGTTGIRYGFQVVSSSAGGTLIVDDIELSLDPFVYKNLTETQYIQGSGGTADGSTNTTIPYVTTVTSSGTGLITVATNSTDGTSFTAVKKCKVIATWSDASTVSTYLGWSLNSAQLTTAIQSITQANRIALTYESIGTAGQAVTAVVEMEAGDVLRPHGTGDTGFGKRSIQLIATSESEHVVTPAKIQSARVVGSGNSGASITANVTNIDFTEVTDTDSAWNGSQFTAPRAANYLINGSIHSTTSIAADIFLYVDAASVRRIDRNGASNVILDFDFQVYLNKDEVLSLRSDTSFTESNSSSHHLSIQEIPSETQFLAAVPVQKVAFLKDVKSSGTGGGTFTSGAWRDRTLNTVSGDSEIVSLSSNEFTLQVGKYIIEGWATGYAVYYHKAKLYDVTNTTDKIIGSSERAEVTDSTATKSNFEDVITLTEATTFKVQHQCQTTNANGFGPANTFSVDEVYAQVKITKLR